MNRNSTYHHVQSAPLCLLLYGLAIVFFAVGVGLKNEPPMVWLFLPIGLTMLITAGSFHHLVVEDIGDRLMIRFGPIPLFRRTIRYEDILDVEPGRTTILDGWGIHLSLRGGWVWNLWGRDCVVLQLRSGVLRIGTDDPENLTEFLRQRTRH